MTIVDTALHDSLRALKLSGMLHTLDARLAQARAGELALRVPTITCALVTAAWPRRPDLVPGRVAQPDVSLTTDRRGCGAVLFRLAYLTVTNGLAMLRLLPMSDRAKDVEILALRHQLTVLERKWAVRGCGSLPLTGPSSPLCCSHSPGPCCTRSGCWCARTRCCAGTAT